MVMEMHDILRPDVEIWDVFNREEDAHRAVMDIVHAECTLKPQIDDVVIDDVVYFCNRG